jgi:outer membrane protein TolC
LPSATAASSIVRTNHVPAFGLPQSSGTLVIFPDIPNNYSARVDMTVPVLTGGRVDALVASAEASHQASVADRGTTTADITLQTVTAYWSLVTARQRVVVLERALARADAEVSDVSARVATGILPPNDLQSAQAQRARQNVLLIQARADAVSAQMQLARLIGVAITSDLQLSTPVDVPTAKATALAADSPEALVDRAARSRTERQSLVSHEAASTATAEAVRAATLPQVFGVAGVQPARPNAQFVPRRDEWNTSWNVGVNVTWSVFDGGRSRAERASALAAADAAKSRIDDFDRGVAVEVRQRLLDIETARASLEASVEGVAAATEARRVVGERFAVGVATNTDVLSADVAQIQAELDQLEFAAGLRLAEARLIRTVGESW